MHLRLLSEHGGLPGVRDSGLLHSALERPRNRLAYGEPTPDLADLAAAYAFGLAGNHPFVDGNKRVSLVTCRILLLLNGMDLVATQEEKVQTWRQLAAGEMSEPVLATWIRGRLSPGT